MAVIFGPVSLKYTPCAMPKPVRSVLFLFAVVSLAMLLLLLSGPGLVVSRGLPEDPAGSDSTAYTISRDLLQVSDGLVVQGDSRNGTRLLDVQTLQCSSKSPCSTKGNPVSCTKQQCICKNADQFYDPTRGCNDYQVVQRPGKTWLIFFRPLSTFADARKRCQKEGGDLVTTKDLDEDADLRNAARIVDVFYFWIGLGSKTGKPTTDKKEWKWLSTGETPTFDGWLKVPWLPAQPDNSHGKQGLTAKMTIRGWDDTEETSLLQFVCSVGK